MCEPAYLLCNFLFQAVSYVRHIVRYDMDIVTFYHLDSLQYLVIMIKLMYYKTANTKQIGKSTRLLIDNTLYH